MSYQVLANKWRPRSFAEMVGQQHVLRALINALDQNRVHHAFLFTGTRGVGKTTIARILAKALNCEQGVSSKPCGLCSVCTQIDQGRFVDLIEVDAASRTKVEDTRELLDNVQYSPTQGRYKVYLIDEVHMLSTHSFNALLKTLEEPPAHIKFLLATTDPQKLPMTILSRCLQFNLKRLPTPLISERLSFILAQEKIAAEDAALSVIARAADGSLRDALSLLDQAIAYGNNSLRTQDVHELLGTVSQNFMYPLLAAVAAGRAADVMEQIEHLNERAPDFEGLLAELITLLHRVALAQRVPEALDEYFDDREQVLRLAHDLHEEDVQLYYQIALHGRRDLPLAPNAKDGFEMLLLRMLAFRPADGRGSRRDRSRERADRDVGPGLQAQHGTRSDEAGSKTPSDHRAAPGAVAEPDAVETKVPIDRPASTLADSKITTSKKSTPAESPPAEAANPVVDSTWTKVIESLRLVGAVKQLALNCTLERRTPEAIHLNLDPNFGALASDAVRNRLEQALQQHYGKETKLKLRITPTATETPAQQEKRALQERHQQAVQAIEQDATVQTLQNVFNTRVTPEHIIPRESGE